MRLIKLILPADLSANLTVEVSDVEVQVSLREAPKDDEAGKQRLSGSTRTSMDRPRKDHPPIYDPDGSKKPGGLEGLIPNSEDIAQSFLETEPEEEIQELESVVASQSQNLHQSTTYGSESSSSGDLGIGAATTLPSFVTDLVKGVFDRFQLRVTGIVVKIAWDVAPKQGFMTGEGTPKDAVQFLLQIEEVRLDAVDPSPTPEDLLHAKRQFNMSGARICLLGEPEGSFRTHTASNDSSPSLTSRSSTFRSSGASDVRSSDSNASASPIISRVASWVPSQGGGDRGLYSSGAAAGNAANTEVSTHDTQRESLIERSYPGTASIQSEYETDGGSSGLQINEPSSTDQADAGSNSSNGEMYASNLAIRGQLRRQSETSRSSILGSQTFSATQRDGSENLAESQLFTHDDAESMYMSAMSGATSTTGQAMAMPGSWSVYRPATRHVHESVAIQPSGQISGRTRDNLESAIQPSTSTEPAARPTTQETAIGDIPLVPGKITDGQDREMPAQEIPQPHKHALFIGTTVLREIVTVDRITCWFPSLFDTPTAPDASIETPSPAAPSVQSVRFARPTSDSHMDMSVTSGVGSIYQPPVESRNVDVGKSGVEVNVSALRVDFDIALVKALLALSQVVKVGQSKPEQPVRSKEGQSSPNMKFTISQLSINFLEQLPGQVVTNDTIPSSSLLENGPRTERDVLLSLTMKELACVSLPSTKQNESRVSISKCVLSHGTGNILSFGEHEIPQSGPTQEALTPPCLSAVVILADQLTHIDLKTMPVLLKLDLRALEEILTKAGGLSSLLELGNSIASVSTIKGVSSKPTTPKKIRGVRFEQAPPPKTPSDGRRTKINVRLASFNLSLIGSERNIAISTSSVKLVQRVEGLGLQIDRTELIGPLVQSSESQAPLKITLSNIRMEYLETPKEVDIDRLLRLITPSKDKYDEADDIMLDTLMRQRSKGAVLRLTLGSVHTSLNDVAEMKHFLGLSADLSRLSGVTKYLPEDDRPGILTLLLIKEVNMQGTVNDKIGRLEIKLQSLEVAYINLPSLTAAQVTTLTVRRNTTEDIVIPAIMERQPHHPMLMCRFIAGEMEPTLKIKVFNTLIEYRVPTLVAFLGLGEEVTEEDLALGMAASFADLQAIQLHQKDTIRSSPGSSKSEAAEPLLKDIRIDVGMRDLVLGLNPDNAESKGLICLTDAKVYIASPKGKDLAVDLTIRKASILVVDDQSRLDEKPLVHAPVTTKSASAVTSFTAIGYVSVGDLSSASAKVRLVHNEATGTDSVDVELRDDLFVLETCADSTQTLAALLNGLKPPAPVSKIAKYRTEIVPLQDMLASFSGDAFVSDQGPDNGLRTEPPVSSNLSQGDEEGDEELEYVSGFYEAPIEESHENLVESSESGEFPRLGGSDFRQSEGHALSSPDPEPELSPEDMVASALNFEDDYFARNSVVGGTAHNWKGDNNYGHSRERKYQDFPIKVKVRDVHFIWNLFDGYDWQRTRDKISQAVQEIEVKAASRKGRPGSHLAAEAEDEEESVIGDFLFNSIYIGIPAHRDPHELAREINRGIDDDVSETGSYATSTTATSSPSRQNQPSRTRSKRLKLGRSKHHKMTFELSGVSADVLVFPPDSGETQSSIDIRVKDLVIFDHVPTSTWRRFATYMRDAGEKETGTNMVHIEMLNVKPVPELAATEMILKVSVLPLRLHVDQDALDFMSRFFEFKDDSSPAQVSTSNPPFIQRIEVNPVRVRLDFKPKRVDYAGLRSGRTTEFMNFFILDQADMVLRRVILYGVSGFDRLGVMLNSVWMPDIKRNQLPGVLAGLAPIRSLVNVGSGVKDLVVLPVREYQKDGRIVRSIQKGAIAFAKTTTSELVKLGAKVALGTQTVLQNTETMLGQGGETSARGAETWENVEDEDNETQKQISLYADQPIGVIQGLRGAYASLERDLLLARDAIVAVPGEVMESSSAKGAAKAVLMKAPTVILRPAIGATKAVGQTLLGAGNTLDRENYRRAEEVSIFVIPQRRLHDTDSSSRNTKGIDCAFATHRIFDPWVQRIFLRSLHSQALRFKLGHQIGMFTDTLRRI